MTFTCSELWVGNRRFSLLCKARHGCPSEIMFHATRKAIDFHQIKIVVILEMNLKSTKQLICKFHNSFMYLPLSFGTKHNLSLTWKCPREWPQGRGHSRERSPWTWARNLLRVCPPQGPKRPLDPESKGRWWSPAAAPLEALLPDLPSASRGSLCCPGWWLWCPVGERAWLGYLALGSSSCNKWVAGINWDWNYTMTKSLFKRLVIKWTTRLIHTPVDKS